MFFRVENLGPLREGELDLSKEMILLTGPNSTGKTYAAWSVYGLYREPMASAPLRPLVDEILASPDLSVGFDRLAALWPSLLDATAAQLTSRIHLCFASERRFFADVKMALRAGAGEPRVWSENNYGVPVPRPYALQVSIGAQIKLQFYRMTPQADPGFGPIPFSEIPESSKGGLVESLERGFALAVKLYCWPRCTLLPTERVDVDMFARELSTRRVELLGQVVDAEIEARPGATSIARDAGRYPWPIQDSLVMANDLQYIEKGHSSFADLAVELETLLGGTVALSEYGELTFTPAGTTQALGIHLTSSMVKSLVRLVFYFRHQAQKGDLLMIDEPELNLHPDNQRKLARVLAKAVNGGLRMIMSTHSDYILHELNYLIFLGHDTKPVKNLRAELHYTDDMLLDPAKLGVYLFKDGKAEAVPVTADEGFEVRTVEDEIRKVTSVAQRIFAALDGYDTDADE